MTKIKKQQYICFAIVFGVILIDQIIKILVKTNMHLHESIRITDWFFIAFTENNGMAFGMEFIGKLFLTLFRLVAVGAISFFVYKVIQRKPKTGFVIFMAMIIAGAAGNIFDCLFYGCIFSESTHRMIATFVPLGEGYQEFLHGKVVDMFYFPLFSFDWPNWVPWVGGDEFIFFSPIFNFADASISVGVVGLLLWYRQSLSRYMDAIFSR
ncbi:MAG: lipoprotein signal peptidase [Bacteroidaceae bacterium]|nr:lipoprotein signal peptidase [Bacteroidaceae bacterium]